MAVGNATLTTLDNVLKTQFESKLPILAYAEDPFLAKIKKNTKFTGRKLRLSLRYGSPQGGSNTIGTAITNKTSSSDAAFELTRAKDYHVGGIDGDAIVDDSEGSIIDTLKGEMDGNTRMIRRSLEIGVYGNGGGARGKLDGTLAVANTGPFVLTDPRQIVNFEVGMKIMTSSADGTSGAIRGGTAATIASLDRDLGTITFAANLDSTVTTPGTGDYLFREGDFGLAIKGLGAWLPTTAPGATAFFGQDRSVDVTRLGGIRFTGTGPMEQVAVKALARVTREGGKPDTLLMNAEEWADLALSVGSRGTIEMSKTKDGMFGFDSLKLMGPARSVDIMGSINVARGRFYLLQTDTWVLASKGACPHIASDDGLRALRDATGDGVTWRLRYYAQLGCTAPGWNLVGTW